MISNILEKIKSRFLGLFYPAAKYSLLECEHGTEKVNNVKGYEKKSIWKSKIELFFCSNSALIVKIMKLPSKGY